MRKSVCSTVQQVFFGLYDQEVALKPFTFPVRPDHLKGLIFLKFYIYIYGICLSCVLSTVEFTLFPYTHLSIQVQFLLEEEEKTFYMECHITL